MRSGSSSSLLKSVLARMFISSKSCHLLPVTSWHLNRVAVWNVHIHADVHRECTSVCPVKILPTNLESYLGWIYSHPRGWHHPMALVHLLLQFLMGTVLSWCGSSFAHLCSVLWWGGLCGIASCCCSAGSCNLVSSMHGLGIKVSGYLSMSSSLI